MHRNVRSAAAALLMLSLLVVPLRYASKAEAAVKIPENIRIGLYFNANNTSTAVSSFSINADKGLQIGFLDGGKFVEVYEESSSDSITVRKDAYYVKAGSAFKETNASSAASADGEKLGPYHIRIGKEHRDLKSAYEKIAAYKKNGVDAYPVYTGKWQIWSGFFVDAGSAEKRMDKIEKALKNEDISLIEPAGGRIAAFSAREEPLFLLSSNSTIFQAVPVKENNPRVIRLNGTLYRGTIEARRFASSDMTVINLLKMEEYLYGVVPCEMESTSHPEALKAQAVAARTYAVYNMGKYQAIGFDLCNTVYSQVYKGFSIEKASTNKAVEDTKGEILTYEGKPAQVYYFSSSGGATEDVENVWSASIPYLRSVEDKYESGNSYRYSWESVFTRAEIKQKMLEKNLDLGEITGVEITKVTDSGRALEVVVKGSKGMQSFSKEGCRTFLSSLYSRLYTITTDADVYVKGADQQPLRVQMGGKKALTANGVKAIKASGGKITIKGAGNSKKNIPLVPEKYIFSGKGNGHAVGMSQEGAKGMAAAGFTYDEILTHYFQGTKVE